MYKINTNVSSAEDTPATSIANLIALSVGYYIVAWLGITQIWLTIVVAGMPDAVHTYFGISTPCEAHTGIHIQYSPFINFFINWGLDLLYIFFALLGWVIVFTRTYTTVLMRYLAIIFINSQSVMSLARYSVQLFCLYTIRSGWHIYSPSKQKGN